MFFLLPPAASRGLAGAGAPLVRTAGPRLMLAPVVDEEEFGLPGALEQTQFAQGRYQRPGLPLPLGGEFHVVGVQPAQAAVAAVGGGPQPQAEQAEHAFRAKAAAQFLQFGVLEKVELEADVDVHAVSLAFSRWRGPGGGCARPLFSQM